MMIVLVIGAFLVIAAMSTAIYIPVLKGYGVSEKLLVRSAKVGFYSSGILVASSAFISLLDSTDTAKISSLPGVVFCTYFTGRLLKKNLNIKSALAYVTAFGVLLACVFVIIGAILIFGTPQ